MNDFDAPLICVAAGLPICQQCWRHFPYAGQASHANGQVLRGRINRLPRSPRQIWCQRYGRYLYLRHCSHVCRSYRNLAIHRHPCHRQRHRLPSFRRLQIRRLHRHHPLPDYHRHRFGLRQRLIVRRPARSGCRRHHPDHHHYQHCHPDRMLNHQGLFQARQLGGAIIRQILPDHQASLAVLVINLRPGSGSRGAINPSPLIGF